MSNQPVQVIQGQHHYPAQNNYHPPQHGNGGSYVSASYHQQQPPPPQQQQPYTRHNTQVSERRTSFVCLKFPIKIPVISYLGLGNINEASSES